MGGKTGVKSPTAEGEIWRKDAKEKRMQKAND